VYTVNYRECYNRATAAASAGGRPYWIGLPLGGEKSGARLEYKNWLCHFVTCLFTGLA